MKANEYVEKIREMTDDEIRKEEKELKSELFKLRFQHATSQLENPMKIKIVKGQIAKILTIMRERELARVDGYLKEKLTGEKLNKIEKKAKKQKEEKEYLKEDAEIRKKIESVNAKLKAKRKKGEEQNEELKEKLRNEERELKTQLFELRFNHKAGKYEKPVRAREIKKNAERMLSIIKKSEAGN